MQKLNILQIGTADNRGGAALVSYHLKRKLEKLGHITSMFVKQKYSDDKNIFLIEKFYGEFPDKYFNEGKE